MKNRLSIVSVVCILIVVILIVSTILQSNYNINKIDDENSNADKLPTVNTKEKLVSLLPNYNTKNYMLDGIAPSAEMNASQKGAAADTDYSTTNTQVQGVDEADLVKTDGKYIYSISKGDLIITEATPVESMNITTNLFKDEKVNPIEMMINDNYLTVICNNNNYNLYDGVKSMMMPYNNSDTTTTYVYNIFDKKNIVKVKTTQMDGAYLTSRTVNNSVYVITNKYVWNNESEDIRPKYSIDGTEKIIDYDQIFYFPGTNCSSYTIIAIIDLSNISNEPKVTSYLSSAQNVYMSLDNLYITTSSMNNGNIQTFAINNDFTSLTSIYKFSIKNSSTEFIARAELKGNTLNQFLPQLYNQQPASLKIAALLHKPDALQYPIIIDYLGFNVPNIFLLGFGLDYDGFGRNLSEIYQLVES